MTGHDEPCCSGERCRAALAVALPTGALARQCAQLALPPEPRSVPAARRFVGARLPELGDEVRDALLLLTSELVTNAVIHARTQLEVSLVVTGTDVVVTVHDEDLGRGEQPADDRDGGRGLVLVRLLSCDNGLLQHRGGGKTAWFRLARAAPASGRDAVAS